MSESGQGGNMSTHSPNMPALQAKIFQRHNIITASVCFVRGCLAEHC